MYSKANVSGTSMQKVGKHRQYLESYLAFGFTYTEPQEKPLPICIICEQVEMTLHIKTFALEW